MQCRTQTESEPCVVPFISFGRLDCEVEGVPFETLQLLSPRYRYRYDAITRDTCESTKARPTKEGEEH